MLSIDQIFFSKIVVDILLLSYYKGSSHEDGENNLFQVVCKWIKRCGIHLNKLKISNERKHNFL